jgi:primosomal protein N' (replication factor Y)
VDLRPASIFPLVTARALAHEFTYLVSDDVRVGQVVRVRLGGRRVRGVVSEVGVTPPPGIELSQVEELVERIPAHLVELALWLSAYYGSTPGRALALVAPAMPGRRGARARPLEREALVAEPAPEHLTRSQEEAVGRIVQSLDEGGRPFLLYGATGSGKTEVYLRACAAALERGKGAIVLVPEISLTPQTLGRFRQRFGEEIAVLHSRLTVAERRDERERIASGQARVVIGARSAVFAPVADLGLIVCDEEHDPSFKQESDPRYDARTVAVKRAALEHAVAVFGSATPRPESWLALERLELGGRLIGKLPPVRVVDMRRERGFPLSAPLIEELDAVVRADAKAILLLNRRGLISALHCRACGHTPRCPACDVALVLHSGGALQCHHCGHSEPEPEVCPACGSPELSRIGAGTQKLERELERLFPGLERIRLDSDTTGRPGALAEALARFATVKSAVLLGTQMIAKGHHFPGVALAAVVDADAGLAQPDFRAEERTFQLLTQLAGRSGRDAPGRVVIQTFQPDSESVRFAARHDVVGFLGAEIERRKELDYPPFKHLVRIVASGPEQAQALRLLEEIRDGIPDENLIGPASLFRLRGRYRAQLVGKSAQPRRIAQRAAELLAAAAPAMRRADLSAVVDVDPQGF